MESVQTIGIAWYEPGTFAAAMLIMKDRHLLPRTYTEWARNAESLEHKLRAQGLRVVRATIKPAEFAAWCSARGLHVDAEARKTFANGIALEEHGNAG